MFKRVNTKVNRSNIRYLLISNQCCSQICLLIDNKWSQHRNRTLIRCEKPYNRKRVIINWINIKSSSTPAILSLRISKLRTLSHIQRPETDNSKFFFWVKWQTQQTTMFCNRFGVICSSYLEKQTTRQASDNNVIGSSSLILK